MEIVIGRIYRTKHLLRQYGTLTRIFKYGGQGYHSGRGCTHFTAIPYNFYRKQDLLEATIEEINYFLEWEMKSGLAQKWNK
jgi:hypothetical protein